VIADISSGNKDHLMCEMIWIIIFVLKNRCGFIDWLRMMGQYINELTNT
jgi:hypothetical protein